MEVERDKSDVLDYINYDFITNRSTFSIQIQKSGLETLKLSTLTVIMPGTPDPVTSDLGFIRIHCQDFGDSFDQLGRQNGLMANIAQTRSLGTNTVYELKANDIESCIELPNTISNITFHVCDEKDVPLSGNFKVSISLHIYYIKQC